MPTPSEKAYYVTKTLEEMQTQIKDLYEIHHACSLDVNKAITKLDVKSGIWYTLAGAVPGIAAILILLFKGLL
jgi:hypothetical protein